MKCKDVPTEPILRFLAKHQGHWCGWWALAPVTPGAMPSVTEAMPPATPSKLVLAKMRMLLRAGLVSGCGCGCRGDFEITDKGLERIGAERGERCRCWPPT